MEAKLKEYRRREQRRLAVERFKKSVYTLFDRLYSFCDLKRFFAPPRLNGTVKELTGVPTTVSDDEDNKQICWTNLLKIGSIWLLLYAFFIHIEFGAVYFGFSVLILIWVNTRTGPKRAGEVSAYSVFNANCEAIDGTLKPEQFEKEIRGQF